MELSRKMFKAVFPRRQNFSGSLRAVLLAALIINSICHAVVVFKAGGCQRQEVFVFFKCAYLFAFEDKFFDGVDRLLE